MRIATATAFDESIANLQRRQESLALAQNQLTSGKRVLNPSDDPAAAARIERASTTISLSDARTRALDVAKSNRQLGESALADGGQLMQQARELLVQAGNGGQRGLGRSLPPSRLMRPRSLPAVPHVPRPAMPPPNPCLTAKTF